MAAELAGPGESRVEAKKSVFWGLVAPVDTVARADELLAGVKKRHYSARHHCTALIVGEVQRSSDDGEPGGSAGAPMLAVLRHRQLSGVFAVVTRYFGGTLLGVGGLIRAYTQAVNEALDAAGIRQIVPVTQLRVRCPLPQAGLFENGLRVWAAANAALVDDVDYASDVVFTMTIPEPAVESLHLLLAPWSGRGVAEA